MKAKDLVFKLMEDMLIKYSLALLKKWRLKAEALIYGVSYINQESSSKIFKLFSVNVFAKTVIKLFAAQCLNLYGQGKPSNFTTVIEAKRRSR